MDGINWTKLITLLLVNIGVILLCLFNRIGADASVAVFGASLGYVFGNGHGLAEAKKYVSGGVK